MRTLMLIASVAMIASGIFCVANSSAAFLSIAFVLGAVFMLLGGCEIIIGRRADFERDELGISLTKDGILLFILGAVAISGQITDDTVAVMLFGLFLTVEGVMSFRTDRWSVAHIDKERRSGITISAAMLIMGIYMFFNNVTFGAPIMLLIGIAVIILGLRRFMQSFTIEYIRPGFITGNEEKLKEAEEEEKRALAKAKEGIREQKIAQRRIKKIKEDIDAEQSMILDAQMRQRERESDDDLSE